MTSTKEINSIRAIIVDDEKSVRSALREIIQRSFTYIEIVAEAANIPETVREVHKHQPDLLFLDIDMPGYTGLQILEFFNPQEVTFDIIFVTAYNEYALQAFKISAFDYLLKPVNVNELSQTLERYLQKEKKQKLSERVELLRETIAQGEPSQLAISSLSNIEFINTDDILLLEASGTYTTLLLEGGDKITSSKPLGEFEELLKSKSNFFRTHRSFIINLKYVKKLSQKDGDIVLKNGTEVPLSRYRRKEFEDSIKAFKI